VIKPDPEKIKALKSYQKPTKIKELGTFLGLANYCRDL
jgi:hypothetical protein